MLNASIFDKRPPYVRFFEAEHGINPEASKLAGRPIPRVLFFAGITSVGSKDEHHAIAEEWLASIRAKAERGDYPPEWSNHFQAQFDAWKRGNELPREGTPVKTWQSATREQSARCHALGHTTVEDLATVPDSGLGQIGPDGRYLRDLARAWIAEAKDKGVVAKELADLKLRCTENEKTINSQRDRIAVLEAQVAEKPRSLKLPPKRIGSIMDEDEA